MGGGRIQAESSAFTITVITSIINIADHADRDRAHRQDRPQAAAADRLDRHGGHTGHDGDHLRQCTPSGRRRRRTCPARPVPIALIAANLFVVAFGMSWGPVVWVLLGEMFPNRIRARRARPGRGRPVGGQLADHRHVPRAARVLGLAYGFYGLCAVLSVMFVWRWVMETKGVHLEDMHGESLHHEKPTANHLTASRTKTALVTAGTPAQRRGTIACP